MGLTCNISVARRVKHLTLLYTFCFREQTGQTGLVIETAINTAEL